MHIIDRDSVNVAPASNYTAFTGGGGHPTTVVYSRLKGHAIRAACTGRSVKACFMIRIKQCPKTVDHKARCTYLASWWWIYATFIVQNRRYSCFVMERFCTIEFERSIAQWSTRKCLLLTACGHYFQLFAI